jgi:hypothetical protein
MLEQLRPPTDNLYKFLALSGLAMFLLGIYMVATLDMELQKFRELADEADDRAYVVEAEYKGDIQNIDDDLKAKLIDAQAANAKKKKLYDKMIATTSKYKKDRAEARASYHKIYVELRSKLDWLNGLMWAGGIVGVAGFWLWYKRLQQPLDEIMRYDLAERRDRANKPKT